MAGKGNPKGTPRPPGSGRQKGTSNKDTSLIRGMIAEALHLSGGVSYLKRQADENPVAFMTLIGKVIPKEVDATVEMRGQIVIKASREDLDL